VIATLPDQETTPPIKHRGHARFDAKVLGAAPQRHWILMHSMNLYLDISADSLGGARQYATVRRDVLVLVHIHTIYGVVANQQRLQDTRLEGRCVHSGIEIERIRLDTLLG